MMNYENLRKYEGLFHAHSEELPMKHLERMAEDLTEMLDGNYLCRVVPVRRNNCITNAISVRMDSGKSMVFYPNREDTTRSLFRQVREKLAELEDIDRMLFGSFDANLRIGLTGDLAYIRKCVFRKVADLYEFLYLFVPHKGENYVVKIEPEMLRMTEAEAFAKAQRNMEEGAFLTTMDGALHGSGNMLKMSVQEMTECLAKNQIPMLVIRGEVDDYGAAYALVPHVHTQISMLYPDGYYLLPSSTMEMLAIPKGFMDLAYLRETVRDTNRNLDAVPTEAVLSNNVYEWKNGTLFVAR